MEDITDYDIVNDNIKDNIKDDIKDGRLIDANGIENKMKLLIGKKGLLTDIDVIIIKVLTNKIFVGLLLVLLMIFYTIIGEIFSLVIRLCEISFYVILPIKILVHVLSSDTDLEDMLNSIDLSDSNTSKLKKKYFEVRKIKRLRLEYGDTLLKQAFITIIIKNILEYCMPVISFVPVLGLFHDYIYAFLVLTMFIIQLPTSVINNFLKYIIKNYDGKHEKIFTYPLSDKIMILFKSYFIAKDKNLKISSTRDIIMKNDIVLDGSENEVSNNVYSYLIKIFGKIGVDENKIQITTKNITKTIMLNILNVSKNIFSREHEKNHDIIEIIDNLIEKYSITMESNKKIKNIENAENIESNIGEIKREDRLNFEP